VSTNLGSWTALSNETWCEVTLAEGKFTVSADANDALAAIKSRMEAEYGKKEKYYGALGALFGALAVIVLI